MYMYVYTIGFTIKAHAHNYKRLSCYKLCIGIHVNVKTELHVQLHRHIDLDLHASKPIIGRRSQQQQPACVLFTLLLLLIHVACAD